MKTLLVHLGWELRKIGRRPAAWIGLAVTIAFEAVLFGMLKLPSVRPALDAFMKRVGLPYADFSSGLTHAVNVAGHSVGVLGAVFIALIASESISREVESGSMRMVLCRPVSRFRVWGMKLAACAIYTFVLVAIGSLIALGLGILLEGWGPLHAHIASTGQRVAYAAEDGLQLYLQSIAFLALSLMTVLVIAFALASCGMRGSTAAVTAIAYLLGERLLLQMPFLASARSWFLMYYMTGWTRAFEARPDWGWVPEVYGPLIVFDVAALTGAFLVFRRRDFKP